MGNRKTPTSANARFIELGSLGQPFRSLVNVDHLTNLRYEQSVEDIEIPLGPGTEATYGDDGEMLTPPILAETRKEPTLVGFKIVLLFGEQGQTIAFNNEAESIACYNSILDMIAGTGNPIARMPKLQPMPPEFAPSNLLDPDGVPLDMLSPEEREALADDDVPGEVPDLTDGELSQLENPVIDIDAIADAVEDGLGSDPVEPDDERQ